MSLKTYSYTNLLFFAGLFFLFVSCTNQNADLSKEASTESIADTFAYQTEQFADIKILRYQIPGFDKLTKKEKELVYYLYQAALSGRDIIWDQNYEHNLLIRKTLEAIHETYTGEKNASDFQDFKTYLKRVWFANGIHHHYAKDKFTPDFNEAYFKELCENSDLSSLGMTTEQLLSKITPVIFDPSLAAKKVNLNAEVDMIKNSAVNFYASDITQAEAEAFYKAKENPNDSTPISHGLNSKLVKVNGKIQEKVWKLGGMYSSAIEKIVFWLEKAANVAENQNQEKALRLLIEFYKTGDLKKFDEYSIAWIADTNSVVDVVNGFIEVYEDPLGYKGSFESVLSIKDFESSKRIEAIGKQAQWFEDNSPIAAEHKKKNVKGISAKVITVVVESGDASPSTPIGINLPNANWIRANHGSKSVQLGNIVNAYDLASKSSGFLEEFCASKEELERSKTYGAHSDVLHTDMHEVIGHASGKINPGVGTPKETLKSYSSTLEEGRADLVALYYMLDPKLIEIGVMESLEYGKAGYDDYIRNGLLTQITRLKLGDNIEEAHMRNRQFICKWAFEKGAEEKVIEKVNKDGKTFFVINDYQKLRILFGELLKELQRIKSEGDYNAGKALVEDYGVKVDPELHKEVLARYEKLNAAPYSGFINPVLNAKTDEKGNILDVTVEYPESFSEQMLYYSRNYSFLPTKN